LWPARVMRQKIEKTSRNPAVSVIIPVFNASSFISESIQSVLGQTFRDLEVIVVDDGSTDNTPDEIRAFGSSVRYLRTKNGGPAHARNLGIAAAQGRLIAFQDADDRWLPKKLERQLEYLEKHPEDAVVFSDIATFDEHGFLARSAKEVYGTIPSGDLFGELLMKRFIAMSSVIVRAECLEEVGGFDAVLKGCEDYNLFLRLAGRFKFGLVDEVLVHKRIHPGNFSNDLRQMLEDEITNIRKISALFADRKIPEERLIAEMRLRFGRYHFANGDHSAARRCLLQGARRVSLSRRDWLVLLFLMFPRCVRETLLAARRSRKKPGKPASIVLGPLS